MDDKPVFRYVDEHGSTQTVYQIANSAGVFGFYRGGKDLYFIFPPPPLPKAKRKKDDDENDDEDGSPDPRFLCAGDLRVFAEILDQDGDYSLALTFNDRRGNAVNHEVPIAISQEALLKELESKGLLMTDRLKDRTEIFTYIKNVKPGIQIRGVTEHWQPGKDGTMCYVTQRRMIGEPESGEIYQLSKSARDQFNYSGTIAEWNETLGVATSKNRLMAFAVCVALSGAIFRLLGAKSIIINFYCLSSKGKTTTAMVAASITGTKMIGWDVTYAALEQWARGCNDSLLFIDEMKKGAVTKAQTRELGAKFYLIEGGIPKMRFNQQLLPWKIATISTAEKQMEKFLKEKGVELEGGYAVRCVNILADIGPLGSFDVLTHGFTYPGNYAKQLERWSELFTGVVIEAFLIILTADPSAIDTLRKTIDAFIDDAINRNKLAGAPETLGRILYYFAVFAAAGDYASRIPGWEWPAGWAIQAMRDSFDSWYETEFKVVMQDQDLQDSIHQQGEGRVFDFIRQNPERFRGRQPGSPEVEDLAGYYDTAGEYDEYDIYPKIWQERVLPGFDSEAVARLMKQHGHLVSDGDGRYQRTRKLLCLGRNVQGKFYCVRIPKAEK